MCGAMDCPNCGPAQGYAICGEDATKAIHQSEIAEMRRSQALVPMHLAVSAKNSLRRRIALVRGDCGRARFRFPACAVAGDWRALGYCGADVFR